MAIDKNNTGYTYLFSIIMVLIVGTALAYTSLSLKPLQKKNAADKQMVDILGALGVSTTRVEAKADFPTYVKERLSLNSEGNVLYVSTGDVDPADSSDPFNLDVKKDYRSKRPPSELSFPLYICEKEGEKIYVIPVVGSGLWGPIWGFVALESDMKTIYGAKFDHKGETPGLGAEIKENFFSDKFKGKEIADLSPYFTILKGGSDTHINSVDGITGGTITSVGVGEMIDRTISIYQRYFESVTNSSKQ
ncbi:MAG: NADH:ubiquinone reductase (Na(+)-transporting) subunit C [Flavobacteriales bacterium]|mgnify:FL=1|jgi:Na+-transporting NADH:ubiquinone oxidoreductase subunit C|nr:NADH:ubiquinone reductase (Na(+)-transporting) subunit C [Flavobacteriales bacterium]MBT6174639.1 NADH:ubiquinone reductase (Na(+)-transporting) subunit C [Flavobacteriales bacterium]